MFATNIGGIDRSLRIVLGLGLLLWFFLDRSSGFAHWIKLIGIVPLLTGVWATCPLYSMLGLRTCPMRK